MDSRTLLVLFGVAIALPAVVAGSGAFSLERAGWGGWGDGGSPSPTAIDSCTSITEPGRYLLTADIVDDQSTHLSESCIRIEADDVVLDGDGHRLDGRGVSGTVGIAVSSSGGLSNVSVVRLTVSDWDWGLYYQDVSGGEVRDVTVEHNGAGIAMEETRGVTVRDNEIANNGIGVFVLDASDIAVRSNSVSENLVGVDCDGAEVTFEANAIASNRAPGAASC